MAFLAGVGCGDDKNPGSGEAGQAGSGTGGTGHGGTGHGGSGAGSAGGGAGNGGSDDVGTPLLERPADIAYDCKVTRPMALLGLNPWVGGGLHVSDGLARLTRLEGTMPATVIGMKVTWSSLDIDGKLGPSQALPAPEQGYLSQLTATQVDERVGLLWVESAGTSAQIAFAGLDAAGEVEAPRRLLSSGDGQRYYPILAAGADGYGAVWTRQLTEAGNAIEFVPVQADGTPTGDTKVVLQGTGLVQPQELVAHGDGFLLTYSQIDASNTQGTFYVLLDAAGVRQGEPVKLGGGFGPTSTLRRGDDLLVAWTEQKGDYQSKISRTIRIGAIDASGVRKGPTYALSKAVEDEENVDPLWVDMGDGNAGLFWSQGKVIYVCAGCYPDNRLRFAVFGSQDLTRKSDVLSLPSPNQFGLRAPHAVRLQDDILAVASVTHHVDAEGASVTVHCAP